VTDQSSLASPQLRSFRAWVYDPGDWMRPRGFSTHTLVVRRHALDAVPTRAGSIFRARRVNYVCPAVVIEYLRPFGGPGILVEIGGELGRVAVRGGGKGQLRAALIEAGFSVVETNHVGWEAPRRISIEELGDVLNDVPSCVVRRPRSRSSGDEGCTSDG